MLYTYWIQKNSEKEFSSSDAFVQFSWASRVLLVEYGMCEKATGLTWEYLKQEEVYEGIHFSTFSPINILHANKNELPEK